MQHLFVDARTQGEDIESAAAPRVSRRRIIKIAAVVIVVLALGFWGWRLWWHSRFYVSTDNAYVNADVVEIAAQVSGPITHLEVHDQQHVRAGDLLLQVDPAPFELAVERAQAQLRLAQQNVSQEEAAVAAAEALVTQRRAELANAQSNDRRARTLGTSGVIAAQTAETAHTQFVTAAAALNAAIAQLEQARSALGEAGEKNAAVEAANAAVAQARLDLQRTRVLAPTSGTIANLTLRPGAPVQALAPLFSIVSDDSFWVDANFKETQLSRVRPGQRASVVADMYRNHVFTGEVQSLSGGSGTAFSLLPPQNATGNWVKVTQRVPVRVRILDPDPAHPLRIGTTATVEVKAR